MAKYQTVMPTHSAVIPEEGDGKEQITFNTEAESYPCTPLTPEIRQSILENVTRVLDEATHLGEALTTASLEQVPSPDEWERWRFDGTTKIVIVVHKEPS